MYVFADRLPWSAVRSNVHQVTPRAIIYGRQSKGEIKSIEDQLELQTKDVLQQGWAPSETLQDGVSASTFRTKARDDWPKLLVALENGDAEYVCFWDSSRGSRDAGEWLSFLKLCDRMNVKIRLTSSETTYDMRNAGDWKTLASEGVDSDSFSRRLSTNSRRGVNSRAMRGDPPGKMLYGYDRIRTPIGKVIEQIAHPQQAPIVVRIFTEFSQGRSLGKICDDLNAEGIESPNGSIWRHATVRRIMQNRAYLGERWHKGEYVAKGNWPALIDPEVFASVGEILADPSRLTRIDGGFKHWLSGFATCDVCGSILRVLKFRGVEQYRCAAKHCVMIRKDELEEYVAEEVRDRMLKMEERPTDPKKQEKRNKALAEIKRLQGLINKTAEDLVSGVTSDYAMAQKVSAGAHQAIARQRQIADANISDKVVMVLKTAGADWFGLDPEQKRSVAQSLVTVRVQRVGKFGHHRTRVAAEDRVVVEDAEVEDFDVGEDEKI